MCFLLQAAIASAYLSVGRNWSLLEVCRCFSQVFESYDCRTKFFDWHGKQQPIVWNFCCESEVSGWFHLKTVHSDLSSPAEAMTRPI